jgi:hypothetical protein
LNSKTMERHKIVKSEYVKTYTRSSGFQVGPAKLTYHQYNLEVVA